MAIAEMLRKHRRTIQTAAQGRERKQSPRVPDSPIVKNKPWKFLKPEFWPISWKFVPAKITNHTVLVYMCSVIVGVSLSAPHMSVEAYPACLSICNKIPYAQ